MIDTKDRRYLVDLLIDLIASSESPRVALCAAVPHRDFAAVLATSPMPATVISHAVALCAEAGKRHDPPWLAALLGSPLLAFAMQGDQRLQAMRLQVDAAPDEPDVAALLGATWLNKATPFVNRSRLRANLVFLESQAAQQQPILVVNGAAKAGKSYTSRYVEHFVFTQAAVPRIVTHRIEFKPDQSLSLGPEQLAKDMVYSLARPFTDKPLPDTNKKLYAHQLAAWVLSEAVQTQVRHWFILDGFRADPSVPDTHKPRVDTLDLLVELSDLVTTGTYVEQCRLILTGFDRSLLTVDPGKVEEETVRPCSRADALQCLHEVLQKAPATVPLDRLESLMFDGLPPGADHMPELNARLRALVHAMGALPDILGGAPGAEYGEVLLAMLQDLPGGARRGPELTLRLEALSAGVLEGQSP